MRNAERRRAKQRSQSEGFHHAGQRLASGSLGLNNSNQTIENVSFGGLAATNAAQGIINTGTGVLTLGGTSSAANVLYLSDGVPLGAAINGRLDLGGARVVQIGDSFSASADLTVSAVISGAAGSELIKDETGTLVLSGVNTYSGPTTIKKGVLRHAVNNNVLPTSTTVTIGNAAGTSLWDLNNLNQTVTGITFHGAASNNTTQASIATGTGTLSLKAI